MSEPSGSPSGEREVSRMAGSTGLEPAASGRDRPAPMTAERSRPRENRGRLSRTLVVRCRSWTRVSERLANSCNPPKRQRRITVREALSCAGPSMETVIFHAADCSFDQEGEICRRDALDPIADALDRLARSDHRRRRIGLAACAWEPAAGAFELEEDRRDVRSLFSLLGGQAFGAYP
jgi:hypothetical protein